MNIYTALVIASGYIATIVMWYRYEAEKKDRIYYQKLYERYQEKTQVLEAIVYSKKRGKK